MYSYLVCADYMTDLSTSRRALFRSLVSIIYRDQFPPANCLQKVIKSATLNPLCYQTTTRQNCSVSH